MAKLPNTSDYIIPPEDFLLRARAWRLGIEIPSEWWSSIQADTMEATRKRNEHGIPVGLELGRFLTNEGKSRLEFLIAEAETKKKDAQLERLHKRVSIYVQIASQVVAILFGLIGAAIALISLLKR
jgi:hypothetical protein